MDIRHVARIALLGTLLAAYVLPAAAADADPAVVIEWNKLAQQTIPGTAPPPVILRHYTLMHVAMFDAANSIAQDYTPFHSAVEGPSGASTEAAVAQAAHDVLLALLPGDAAKKTLYDAALTARLASIPPGQASLGAGIGAAAAKHAIEWRTGDGILPPTPPAVAPSYVLPTIEGLWRGFPAGQAASLTWLLKAKPFMLESATQFLVPRFPELTSTRYAQDFEEVTNLGGADSPSYKSLRTAEQTQSALLFAGVITNTNIFTMWNNVTGAATTLKKLSLVDSARLFAMVNAAMLDSLVSTMNGKLIYGLWRPVTAIDRATYDGNPATSSTFGWTPLLATPPYPTYPGNMAGIGACAAEALIRGIGADVASLSVTWSGRPPDYPNAVTRNYAGFAALAQDEADSRIFGGIHFRFDNEVSQDSCKKIVEYAYSKVAVPLSN